MCGPFEKVSLRGSSYFVSFIDDYSRKVWIYLLSRKSEVFLTSKRFKVMVETQSRNRIQRLRSDGGSEYTSHEFKKFYEDEGNIHKITPPYAPHHNGVFEILNRTIVNMTRCMLRNFHLPKEFWGEAVSTAAYLLNRCSTKRLENVTPEETWSGSKPCLKHLRVFGCLCFKHVPNQLRRKLDKKGEQMIMLGYHSTGGYKLYDCSSKKVVIKIDEPASELVSDFETADHETLVHIDQNPEVTTDKRPKRTKVPSSRLQGFEVHTDDTITDEG